MSKTKSVQFAGRAVWVFDDAFAVLMKYMLEAFQKRDPTDQATWITEQISAWRVTAGVSDYGWRIDESGPLSPERSRELIALIQEACMRLASESPIPLQEATNWTMLDNLLVVKRPGMWGDPLPIDPILRLSQAIISLIDGTLEPPPEGTWWCFGMPSGRTTITMKVPWDEADS